MNSVPEGNVGIRRATDVEPIRLIKDLRIAIGRTGQRHDDIACTKHLAGEVEVMDDTSLTPLRDTVEAQHFFDSARNELGVIDKPSALIWMLREQDDCICNELLSRLVSGE